MINSRRGIMQMLQLQEVVSQLGSPCRHFRDERGTDVALVVNWYRCSLGIQLSTGQAALMC